MENQNLNILDEVNKFTTGTTIYTNQKAKEMQVAFDVKYNAKDLAAMKMLIKEKMAYVKVNPILEKYMSTPIEYDLFATETIDPAEIEKIISGFEAAHLAAAKEEYFTKEEKTFNIGGKDVKVNANTLDLNENNVFPNNILYSFPENGRNPPPIDLPSRSINARVESTPPIWRTFLKYQSSACTSPCVAVCSGGEWAP